MRVSVALFEKARLVLGRRRGSPQKCVVSARCWGLLQGK
jgi:hypothetical protein